MKRARTPVRSEILAYSEKIMAAKCLFEGKWTLQVLSAIRFEPVRMSQLNRFIPAASKKALRANLKSLEASRIIVRRDLSRTVLHVEYDLTTDMRHSVCALLDHLAAWGEFYSTDRAISGNDTTARESHDEL